MKTISVQPYRPDQKTVWDTFVKDSPNGPFLFYRDFMEYHSDRFNGYSLMIFSGNKAIALLPGHVINTQFCSHLGLTYGGFIFKKYLKTTLVEQVFEATCRFLKEKGFNEFLLKQQPFIYNTHYSSAVDYFLFQCQAKLICRDLNYVIDLSKPLTVHKSKRKIYNKEYIQNLEIKQDTEFKEFWGEVLKPVLKEKHGAEPVHTLAEINYLKRYFPEQVKQVNVYIGDQIIAGMTLFISNGVVKSQYGAATKKGQELKALDFLYQELLKQFKQKGFRYFDLGITTEDEGLSYNQGLSNYKEELGGFPINQDRYLLAL